MAKKTNYLTELIERHERWKAEGGERAEDDERSHAETLDAGSDPEDLWDFGTVRHALTVGRTQTNPVQVSGPPLTWENNGTRRSDESTVSSSGSFPRTPTSNSALSVNTKGELHALPPLPPSAPSTPQKADQQATIRRGGPSLSRESSDEYDDDYEDPEAGTLPHQGAAPTHQAPDDDLPDTTMLDSVVLPAIASLFPRVATQEARVALSALQRAFTEAERIIPGVTMELINEIVDSVEHVEDDH